MGFIAVERKKIPFDGDFVYFSLEKHGKIG